MSGEVGMQPAQEAHHPCGDVLRRGEVRSEGEVVVERTEGDLRMDGGGGVSARGRVGG